MKQYTYPFIRTLLFIGVLLLLPLGSFAQQGQQDNTVSGYAWSETIGWVSMSGDGYGVEAEASGLLKGYAWSEHIGWVSFNAGDVSGCPSGGNCQPRINSETGAVTGWARALAGDDSQSGGWNGWIRLGGNDTQANVAVNSDTCAWSGYAFGGGDSLESGVIGWLSFAGDSYGVTGSGYACNGGGEELSVSCSVSPSSGNAPLEVTWTASAIGGNGNYEYVWSSSDDDVLDGATTETVDRTYNTSGTRTATVTVTSGVGNNAESAACDATAVNVSNQDLEVTLSTNTTTQTIGEAVTLTWDVDNATGSTSCTANNFENEYDDSLSGSEDVVISAEYQGDTITYQLACTDPSRDNDADSVTIDVIRPNVQIDAYPRRVRLGGTTNLTWSATLVSSCTISGPNVGGTGVDQVIQASDFTGDVDPTINGQSTYSIECTDVASNPVPVESVIVNTEIEFEEF